MHPKKKRSQHRRTPSASYQPLSHVLEESVEEYGRASSVMATLQHINDNAEYRVIVDELTLEDCTVSNLNPSQAYLQKLLLEVVPRERPHTRNQVHKRPFNSRMLARNRMREYQFRAIEQFECNLDELVTAPKTTAFF